MEYTISENLKELWTLITFTVRCWFTPKGTYTVLNDENDHEEPYGTIVIMKKWK